MAIATAHHVVRQADKWQQPIRILGGASSETILLQEADRIILPDIKKDRDSAIIIVPTGKIAPLQLPEKPIDLIKTGRHLKVGVEVAWLGYPSIGPETLCFFRGTVSASQEKAEAYLIDGVAINGVSGGPVFSRTIAGGAQIIGSITAYMPNRLTSETLPGLCIAQDVSHFQDFVTDMKNRGEATRKKREQEAESDTSSGTLPPPMPE